MAIQMRKQAASRPGAHGACGLRKRRLLLPSPLENAWRCGKSARVLRCLSSFMTPTQLDAGLLQAYRETHYIVHAQPDFVLHVDQPCAALAAYYALSGIEAGCVITAWNPYSQLLDVAKNQGRQEALEAQLLQAGWHWVRATGTHPDNNWPPEVGCFVEGMGVEAAIEWGLTWEQNAVIWCGNDAIPRLQLLR
jgi:hypothetical protein